MLTCVFLTSAVMRVWWRASRWSQARQWERMGSSLFTATKMVRVLFHVFKNMIASAAVGILVSGFGPVSPPLCVCLC